MSFALDLLLSALTKLGARLISFARQRIAEEVATLNDPTVVKGIASNEDGSVLVTLLPIGADEPTAILIKPSQIAGLAKTQKVINRVGSIFPASANPFLNQLIRAVIEITLLGARALEARKVLLPPPPLAAKEVAK